MAFQHDYLSSSVQQQAESVLRDLWDERIEPQKFTVSANKNFFLFCSSGCRLDGENIPSSAKFPPAGCTNTRCWTTRIRQWQKHERNEHGVDWRCSCGRAFATFLGMRKHVLGSKHAFPAYCTLPAVIHIPKTGGRTITYPYGHVDRSESEESSSEDTNSEDSGSNSNHSNSTCSVTSYIPLPDNETIDPPKPIVAPTERKRKTSNEELNSQSVPAKRHKGEQRQLGSASASASRQISPNMGAVTKEATMDLNEQEQRGIRIEELEVLAGHYRLKSKELDIKARKIDIEIRTLRAKGALD